MAMNVSTPIASMKTASPPVHEKGKSCERERKKNIFFSVGSTIIISKKLDIEGSIVVSYGAEPIPLTHTSHGHINLSTLTSKVQSIYIYI